VRVTLSRIALAAALVLPATTLPLPAAAQATLSADEVVIDAGQQSLEASGDVWFEMPPLVLGADRLVADMETGTLLVDGAFIDASSPDRSVTASAAGAIAGPGGALLEHGSASLCDCDPPPWCLEFTALSIDADGDVVVRRGWLVVGGRRVLPLPWLMLRTGREPGLLPPRFSHLPGRGPLVGIGARFPLPAGWDLDLTIDWVIPRGIAGGVVMAHPGGRLESAIVLDPATEGLDAGWIAGQLDHGGRGWALGIVLDTPLTGSIARGDMPGVHGSSSRTALQSLAIRVAPFGHVLAVTGQIGAARSIEGGIARGGLPVLEPGTTWLRAPSTTITLAPV